MSDAGSATVYSTSIVYYILKLRQYINFRFWPNTEKRI